MEPEEKARLAVRESFDKEAMSINKTETGFANDSFFISLPGGHEVFLKIHGLDESYRESFMTEPSILELLSGETSVNAPENIHVESESEALEKPYHFLEKLPGRTIAFPGSEVDFQRLSIDRKLSIAEDLALNIAGYHSIDFSEPGEIGLKDGKITVKSYEDWREAFRELIDWIYDIAEGNGFGSEIEDLREFMESNIGLLPRETRNVLLHREIDGKNVLVNRNRVGVVDWEGCCSGHYELDLGIAQSRFFGPNFQSEETVERYSSRLYSVYDDIRGLDAGWRERKDIYIAFGLLWNLAFVQNESRKQLYLQRAGDIIYS